jgi:hypothetical protein
MYSAMTDLFLAPVPHDVMARATKNYIYVLLLENVPQIAVVAALQQFLLGDWTILNIVLVSSSVVFTGVGVVHSVWYARGEAKQHVVTAWMQEKPPQSVELVIMADVDARIDADVPPEWTELVIMNTSNENAPIDRDTDQQQGQREADMCTPSD